MAGEFQFDPKDVSNLFNDRRSNRMLGQQGMKASLQDFQRSQQSQQAPSGYPNPKRPPGAGSGIPAGV